jgi:hypothetical protein
VRCAFAIPTVGDRELRLRDVFAVGIGIDQRLQSNAAQLIAVLFDVGDGAVKQNLVRLLLIVGNGIVIGAAAAAAGQHQHRTTSECAKLDRIRFQGRGLLSLMVARIVFWSVPKASSPQQP